MLYVLLDYDLLRALWKIDVYLISTLVNKSQRLHVFCPTKASCLERPLDFRDHFTQRRQRESFMGIELTADRHPHESDQLANQSSHH